MFNFKSHCLTISAYFSIKNIQPVENAIYMTCGEKLKILPIFWCVLRFLSNTLELFLTKYFIITFSQKCANIVKPCDFALKRLLL